MTMARIFIRISWSLLLIISTFSPLPVASEENPEGIVSQDTPDPAASQGMINQPNNHNSDKKDNSPFMVIDQLNCAEGSDGTYQCHFNVVPNESSQDNGESNDDTIREFCIIEETGAPKNLDENVQGHGRKFRLCVQADISGQWLSAETAQDKAVNTENIVADDKKHAVTKTDSQLSKILDEYYKEPLEHYGRHIVRIYDVWKEEDERSSLKEYIQARHWYELGMAHTHDANEETDLGRRQMQVDWAVRAFQHGIRIYTNLSINENNPDDPWFELFRKMRMGVHHYEISNVLALSTNQQKEPKSSRGHLQQANQFLSTCHDALMKNPPTIDQAKEKSDPTKWSSFTTDHLVDPDALQKLWKQARSSWAYTCLHLGTHKINGSAILGNNGEHDDDDEDEDGSDDDEEDDVGDIGTLQDMVEALMSQMQDRSPEEQAQAAQELVQAQLPKIMAKVERGDALFALSSKLYRLMLDNGDDDYTRQIARHLATSQQNRGTTAMSKGDMGSAQIYLEDALNLHTNSMDALGRLTNPDHHIETAMQEMKVQIGEILYNLSDVYFQQGVYDKVNEKYTAAMEWYKKYELTPLQHNELLANADESIRQYEAALEEYHELFESGQANVDYASYEMGQGEGYYQKDDGYEADLHSGLGAYYMTAGDLTMALVHLDQALQLYSNVGESRGTVYAEVLYNKALLLFRQYNFDQSSEVHREAVEIYREVAGEGNHPYMSMMDMSTYQTLLNQAQQDVQQGMQEADMTNNIFQFSINLQGEGQQVNAGQQQTHQHAHQENNEELVGDAGVEENAIDGSANLLNNADADEGSNETDLIDNMILPIHGARI